MKIDLFEYLKGKGFSLEVSNFQITSFLNLDYGKNIAFSHNK